MLVKELIELLSRENPETEVCVHNDPIVDVATLPFYYDGRLSFVKRNENGRPIKAGWRGTGNKVAIFCDDVESVLLDNPELEIDFGGKGTEEDKKVWVENTRVEGRNIQAELDKMRREKNI